MAGGIPLTEFNKLRQPTFTPPEDEYTSTQAVLDHLKFDVLPMAAATGAGVMAASAIGAPFTGGASLLLPIIGAGLVGAGAHAATRKLEERYVSPAFLEKLRKQEQEHPTASLIGSYLPSLLFARPGVAPIKHAIRGFRNLPKAPTSLQLASAGNIGVGVGLGTGYPVYQNIKQHGFDLPSWQLAPILAGAGAGAFLNQPSWLMGKLPGMLGQRPIPARDIEFYKDIIGKEALNVRTGEKKVAPKVAKIIKEPKVTEAESTFNKELLSYIKETHPELSAKIKSEITPEGVRLNTTELTRDEFGKVWEGFKRTITGKVTTKPKGEKGETEINIAKGAVIKKPEVKMPEPPPVEEPAKAPTDVESLKKLGLSEEAIDKLTPKEVQEFLKKTALASKEAATKKPGEGFTPTEKEIAERGYEYETARTRPAWDYWNERMTGARTKEADIPTAGRVRDRAIIDENIKAFERGLIEINPEKQGLDTPIHEGHHEMFNVLKESKIPRYQKLYRAYRKVLENTPEYKEWAKIRSKRGEDSSIDEYMGAEAGARLFKHLYLVEDEKIPFFQRLKEHIKDPENMTPEELNRAIRDTMLHGPTAEKILKGYKFVEPGTISKPPQKRPPEMVTPKRPATEETAQQKKEEKAVELPTSKKLSEEAAAKNWDEIYKKAEGKKVKVSVMDAETGEVTTETINAPRAIKKNKALVDALTKMLNECLGL